MSSAGNFVYIFVGDIDPDVLAPLAEQWIGGQPQGHADETWADAGMRLIGKSQEIKLDAGDEPLSIVTQMWLGDWNGTFDQLMTLRALADALEIKLTRSLREESGGTYSVACTRG